MKKIMKRTLLPSFTMLLWSVSFSIVTIFIGCSSNEKDTDNSILDFKITEVSNITQNSAVINAKLNSSGKEDILFRGICIGTETNPTINNIKYEVQGNVPGQYIGTFENLKFNTTYFARPYVTTTSKTIYGLEFTLTTKNVNAPTVATTTPSSITSNSGVFSGKIDNDGSSKIIAKGFYYSKLNSIPTISDQKVEGTGSVEFSSSVTGLEQNSTYYVRAYATNIGGTSYGQVVSFTTSSSVLPTVTTSDASSILETSAIVGGVVVNEGSSPVTQRGVCYDDFYPQPTITSMHTKDGVGIGSFATSLTNLQPFKTYYVRAYAISAAGIAYGGTTWVKTSGGNKPTVTASGRASGLSAYATVIVTKQGSDNIKDISVRCFDMDGNSVGKITSSSGWSNTNVFLPVNFEISGLSSNTKYYIVGYATNGVGTATSEKSYFSTL